VCKMKDEISMAHLDSSDKTRNLSRNAFLDALYHGLDSALWLELRCIHPITGMVKVLWMPLHRRDAMLRQADSLNRQGFSIYFAPCPRRTRQGDAEGAALLPALWVDVDCEGNAAQRETELAKLRAFKPPPSILLNSGGGWHAFWLLSEPLALPDGAARERAAGLLRGLFLAFGADPKYVKSVASLMRIPDTINTKPERNGAAVTLIECAPERRYALSEFAWLETRPTPSSTSMEKLHLPSDGHAPLPKVTLDYLQGGARKGDRNKALFAAACQFRDAGYPQHEAEAQLLPRYLADAVAGEGAGREYEGRGTIHSAYRGVTRDPLQHSPQSSARRERTPVPQVEALVNTFGTAPAVSERPGPADIAAAITACAGLDPIQWAAERKRIKALCGEEFRLSDLDRMYRQARQETSRSQISASGLAPERYLELEGGMVYERQTERGTLKQPVTSWTARVQEWLTQYTDEGQSEHVMRLALSHGERKLTLDVPSELFGDPNALQRFIAAQAGGLYTVRAGMSKHLVPAILALSGEPAQRSTYRFVGWTQRDGRWTYLSPQVSVHAQGYLAQPPEIELETRLRDYALAQAEWAPALQAFESLIPALPRRLAPALLAFALLPIVQRFFPPAAPRPAIHLVGTSGSGKSEIAALLTSLYGQFTRDAPPAQWGDTVNTVETLGYGLADALYWVDDYKACYADERTFTRFLQSYSRGMGRGRLTREARLRQERPCRGVLLSTGETVIEGEASVMARMLVLEVPPWEQRDPGGQALARAEGQRQALPAFTAHFAAWVAARADAGTLTKDLTQGFEHSVQGYRKSLQARLGGQANAGRMIQNWALLVTVYRLLHDFLETRQAADILPSWQDALVETVQAVQQERAGHMFIDMLGQLLASGQAMLATDMRRPEEPRPGTTIVGYLEGSHIYLLPEVAFREVNRGQPLKFTANAIGAQLREAGWLVPGGSGLTVQRRVRGIATRFWQVKADCLDGDPARQA